MDSRENAAEIMEAETLSRSLSTSAFVFLSYIFSSLTIICLEQATETPVLLRKEAEIPAESYRRFTETNSSYFGLKDT